MEPEEFRPWRRNALAPAIVDDAADAWESFSAWLVEGPRRNLGRLARERKIKLETLEAWAKRGYWRERAAAYDAHLESVRDDAAEVTVTELSRMAVGLASLGSREVGFLSRAQIQLDRPGVIRPNEATRAIVEGIKLHQLLGGRPTERVATEEELDLSALTDEELDLLAALRAKMRKAGSDG